ncbi:hypothetical protein N7508_011176 [Penicillium antarcticum]|uniref:uncharacterized protein n=1 Tax=Penicillium antarcticum TaxID=416450 RepID=UPI0023A5E062|nr:uncharacterized protein N7508_011133 [Penicillium antarcticum]XP_058314214.1 uncharacterized protein N7508_011176 [Penicillium antarcticum]KAJ5288358.1 hypothetical protein N7508_011133 [Penicillium antarcticum]KAJ5288401.1 hypothetical protein N7508_011176 [Penicillium antarcticum]
MVSQDALGLLERFCRSSSSEIEINYPQRLDEDYTLKGSRDACARLRAYICEDKSGFTDALRNALNLQSALREFHRLQRMLFREPLPGPFPETERIGHQSIAAPTMSLQSLLDEIGECAWYIVELLESTDVLVAPSPPYPDHC